MEIDDLAPVTGTDERAGSALARLYDLDLEDDPGDLDLYLALARRTGGPILELAVGSGRLAVPLATAGYEVTGVDNDPAMLSRARERALAAGAAAQGRVRLVEADMVGLDLSSSRNSGNDTAPQPRPARRGRSLHSGIKGFGLALLGLNSLMLLDDRRRQLGALQTMAAGLAPGGLAVVDVWLPDADDLARYDGRLILEYLRRDPESGRWVTKVGSALHDAATATVSLTTIYEESGQGRTPIRWVRHDRLRLVGAEELRTMAAEAGLAVEVVAGGYDLEPLRPGDDRAILVAARPSSHTGLV